MKRYFSILTLSMWQGMFVFLAVGLLMIYLTQPMNPNFKRSGVIFLYILMQIVVVHALLVPILKSWRGCQALHLMPHYNRIVKKVIVGLFTLFIVVPAWIALVNNYDIWLIQMLTLVIWNIYSLIIITRFNFTVSSEKAQSFNSAIFCFYTLFFMGYKENWFGWLDTFDALNTFDVVYFQIIAIGLSLLFFWGGGIEKKYRSKKTTQVKLVRKKLSLNALFWVPKQTKLVFGVLSPSSFLNSLGLYLLVAILFILFEKYSPQNSWIVCNSMLVVVFQQPTLLKQKDKTQILTFWIGGSTQYFERVVYRAFFNTSLFAFIAITICILIINYFIEIDINLSLLFLVMATSLSCLYFLLLVPAPLWAVVFPCALMIGAYFSDYFPLFYITALLFLVWAYIYPPTNWFENKYGKAIEN